MLRSTTHSSDYYHSIHFEVVYMCLLGSRGLVFVLPCSMLILNKLKRKKKRRSLWKDREQEQQRLGDHWKSNTFIFSEVLGMSSTETNLLGSGTCWLLFHAFFFKKHSKNIQSLNIRQNENDFYKWRKVPDFSTFCCSSHTQVYGL